jgi:hypothetical protein
MSSKSSPAVITMGIDIGKARFMSSALTRAARSYCARSCHAVEARLANMLPCLIGMEAALARIT